MRLANHAQLIAGKLSEIEDEVKAQRTLLDVIKWGQADKSGAFLSTVVADVVVQDEFTHDAIVPWRDRLFLVYGMT